MDFSGPVTDQAPGSALGCVTLADALPLVHGLLDEAVRLLSKAVKELGVVAEENLDALADAAGAFGRVAWCSAHDESGKLARRWAPPCGRHRYMPP